MCSFLRQLRRLNRSDNHTGHTPVSHPGSLRLSGQSTITQVSHTPASPPGSLHLSGQSTITQVKAVLQWVTLVHFICLGKVRPHRSYSSESPWFTLGKVQSHRSVILQWVTLVHFICLGKVQSHRSQSTQHQVSGQHGSVSGTQTSLRWKPA